MRYRVTIDRVSYRTHEFYVHASSVEEAKDIALDEAHDFNFTEAHERFAHYNVTETRKIETKES